MRVLLFFYFISLLNLPGLAQPDVGKTTYWQRYAHPQKSNVSVQLRPGLTAMNTAEPFVDDILGQNLFFKPSLTLGLGYLFTNYIGFELRTAYYRHSYNARSSTQDFESIKSNNFEGVLGIRHYLFAVKDFDEYLRKFNYYARAGGGGFYLNPKEQPSGELLAEREGFDKLAPVLFLGLGVEYRLSNFFIMALEADLHLPWSEYLDGQGARGGGRRYDHFAAMGVNLSYRIPRKDYHYHNFLKLKNKG